MSDESYTRSRLRQELARVRDRAGLSTRELGRAIGVSFETVRRTEQGPTLPPLPRVRKWLDACGVATDQQGPILELAERARSETRSWGELLAPGRQPQDELRRDLEEVATLIRGWQPSVFPGVLQTPEYATTILTASWTTDVDGAVAARARRQAALYASTTPRHYLIAESVWRAAWAPSDLAEAQRDRALSLAKSDTVTLAVVPDTTLLAPAWHNFTLYTVEGEVVAGRELIDGSSEVVADDGVQRHETLWSRLLRAAVPAEAFSRDL